MNKFRSDLAEQIADAKKQVRKMKLAAPYLYHEYQELHESKRALAAAKDRYLRAKAAWKALGN
jgi:hypothetical protein